MMKVVLMWAVALAMSTAAPAAHQGASIGIEDSRGKARAAFQPREKPYSPGMRAAASVYLYDQQNIVDQEGLAVTGFAFYGWTDGAKVRVLVFTLVPAKGAPNRYLALPGDSRTSLRLKEFATLTLAAGQTATIDQMKALKLEPFTIRMTAQASETQGATGK